MNTLKLAENPHDIPNQDPAHRRVLADTSRANRNLAARLAARTATFIRELLPTATSAVFSYDRDDCDGDDTWEMVLVYGPDETILWHSAVYADQHNGMPGIDSEALWTLNDLVTETEDMVAKFLPRIEFTMPYTTGPFLSLGITEQLAAGAATEAPEVIRLDRLADLIASYGPTVDTAELTDAIRVLAARP